MLYYFYMEKHDSKGPDFFTEVEQAAKEVNPLFEVTSRLLLQERSRTIRVPADVQIVIREGVNVVFSFRVRANQFVPYNHQTGEQGHLMIENPPDVASIKRQIENSEERL